PSTEDDPAGVTVVPDMSAECSNRLEGLTDRRVFWRRAIGQFLQYLQLERTENGLCREVGMLMCHRANREQVPCDWNHHRDNVLKGVKALELTRFNRATRF
ncbi:MAG: hypothetical protein AAFX94_24660, partial [Myxococcota bacterium]